MQRNSPDFIGIGAPHAGLGVVTKLLSAHPAVVDSIPALNFFNTDDYATKGVAWYEDTLPKKSPGVLTGECSPTYMTTPGVAERIVGEYPDTKLFVIVRNPIERAIVQYEHAKAKRLVSTQISCARYLTTVQKAQTDGFYGHHLREYFTYYSSLQLQVIVYDELVENPLKVIQSLYAFLEIDKEYIPKILAAYAPPPDDPINPSKLTRLILAIKKQIKRMREKPPVPIFPPPYRISAYFTPEELVPFTEAFATDARPLSNFLHRDMGAFWNLEEPKTIVT
jgi:hypothetical protein